MGSEAETARETDELERLELFEGEVMEIVGEVVSGWGAGVMGKEQEAVVPPFACPEPVEGEPRQDQR